MRKKFDTIVCNTCVPLDNRRQLTFTGRARVTCAAAMHQWVLLSGQASHLYILVNEWTDDFFGDAKHFGSLYNGAKS
jgi:hypothetical protein